MAKKSSKKSSKESKKAALTNGQISGIPGDDALNVQQQLYQQNIAQQQALNRPDEVSPLGTSRYVTDPATGKVTRVSSVGNMTDDQIRQAGQNQAQQYLGQQGLGLGIQGVANTSLNNLRGMLSSPIDPNQFAAQRDQTTQAQYDQAMRLMQPQMDYQRQQFEQDQANRGLPRGSGEQYDRNYRAFDRNVNDAQQAAAFSAMQAGNQEQQRLFGNALTARSAQQGELSGLLGMAPTQMPSFQGTAGINVPTVDAANMWLQNEAFKHGGGGGGGGGADPFALAALNNQAQMDRLNATQQFALQQAQDERNYQQSQQPGFGQILGNIGSQFAGSFLGGLGQSAGRNFFGGGSGGGGGSGFFSNFWS